MVRRGAGAAIGLCLTLWAGMASAEAAARDLAALMRMPEMIEAMRIEGLEDAAALDDEMLGGRGGVHWREQAARIYDVTRMEAAVITALDQGMSAEDLTQAQGFFGSDAGQRIVAMEVAARVAMSNAELEEMAQERYLGMTRQSDPLLGPVQHFIETNDLIGRNVTGTMASSYAFYQGMMDGGAVGLDDQTILAMLREQRPDLEAETRDWLHGFLAMAFAPLSAEDVTAYARYSATPSGQALNVALFDGFDLMFVEISFDLGSALARAMTASDL